MRHVVLGTAGHIDHGKTTLVKALTGTDTDWLDEEKARGMTIDLGFAFFGDSITIIDVPGHEKFIRNMVSGVSTIDIVLFVVAADDGVMPQTREHLEILSLLHVKQGIIVITKTDLVDDDWLDLVIDDVQALMTNTFLENAPIIPVSGTKGTGIEQLKQAISDMAANLPIRQDKGIFRLQIDRIFTMHGFGTVVAGTVLSGKLAVDDIVELLPHQKNLRVRGLQIHNTQVKEVKIGDRAAINLSGIEKEAIKRGHVLAKPGQCTPSEFFDATLYLLKQSPRVLQHNGRVHLHIGTNEVLARISLLDRDQLQPGESTYIQLRCEKPVVAEVTDRFVIRSYSPIHTIGGGAILQVKPHRHKRYSSEVLQRLKVLEQGDMQDVLELALLQEKQLVFELSQLAKTVSLPEDETASLLARLYELNKVREIPAKTSRLFIHQQRADQIAETLLKHIERFHKKYPLRQGISAGELRTALKEPLEQSFINYLVNWLGEQDKINFIESKIRLASYTPTLTTEQSQLKSTIIQRYIDAQFAPPKTADLISELKRRSADVESIFAYLIEIGELTAIEEGILIHEKWIDKAQECILSHFEQNPELTVGEFRDMIQASRKYAVPLLGHFDRIGLTTRQEDVRVFNPSFKRSSQ
ncbi:selenocysteine-specific translation elongation factor [candidate division KSB1 bacterium]|nr:selenocysteine-specific translation elongation factor [candidate division KSB1 bacterium]